MIRLWTLWMCLVWSAWAQAEQRPDYVVALDKAGANRAQLEAAVAGVPAEMRAAQEWLIAHMPLEDLQALSAQYLIENCVEAHRAWHTAPWGSTIDRELFLDTILPYANVNEQRDAWRVRLRELCAPMVEGARTPGEAAVRLNQALWAKTGVKYSTKRKKADQSPFETLESGLASCSGLSILLIDACRAVGVPARFVGTALWSDKSGNHSWVEVWDQRWKFTGAAEPTGDQLDQGWFVDRAAGAKLGDPLHAIWAVTWRSSPASFPLVWRPQDTTYRAVDVSERYTMALQTVEAGKARVRVRVLSGSQRVQAELRVQDPDGVVVWTGTSKDERFDANDHATAVLPLGMRCTVYVNGAAAQTIEVQRDEQLVECALALAAPTEAVALSKAACVEASKQAWSAYQSKMLDAAKATVEARELARGDVRMKFWWTKYGERPQAGHSLWISMHGGGGAPARVNDQQWDNQKRLYTLSEGIYVAPRAPTDTWNLWHQGHIDELFDELIRAFIVAEGVDPQRVYLMGYSAGGDGVYQLAPRMADRWAAAAMMAGHPNETRPDGLRNLPFALHMGANDGAYDRNKIAGQWKTSLAELAQADPGAYVHQVVIHEGKGHWMDRLDAAALPWMAGYSRTVHPDKIVWLQDDVVHRNFYWLEAEAPQAGQRLVAERKGQTIRIRDAKDAGALVVHLSDAYIDLDRPIRVERDGAVVYEGKVQRSAQHIQQSIERFGDPQRVYSSSIRVPAPTGR